MDRVWQDCEQERDKEMWEAEALARYALGMEEEDKRLYQEQQRLIALDAAHGA